MTAQMPVARFSEDRAYRYLLTRRVGFGDSMIQFVMLNPSTADETHDDSTIKRCVRYANRWGFGWLAITNVSPFRATDPARLKKRGPEPPDIWDANMENILETAVCADQVVAAWGTAGKWENRASRVETELLGFVDLWCLSTNQDGSPGHPLYLKDGLELKMYKPRSKDGPPW